MNYFGRGYINFLFPFFGGGGGAIAPPPPLPMGAPLLHIIGTELDELYYYLAKVAQKRNGDSVNVRISPKPEYF